MKALRKTRTGIKSHNIGILGFCLLLIIVCILPLSCGKKAGPSDVVEQYFSALKERDIEKVVKLTDVDERIIEIVREHSDELNAEMELRAEDYEYKVISEEIDGSEAKVTIQVKMENGEWVEFIVRLVEIEGEWRLDKDMFDIRDLLREYE